MKKIRIGLCLAMLFQLPCASAAAPDDTVYLQGGDNRNALILAHGRGKYPTWKVVDPLRKGVHKQLGFHTLSLQMPADKKHWKQYAEDFPEAFERFSRAINFLVIEQGVDRVFLMGHSMGARMASAYVLDNLDKPLSGLIVAGCRNNGEPPLACDRSLQHVPIAVLDIWGGEDSRDLEAAAQRAGLQSEYYRQVQINGANHRFDAYEDEFVAAVVLWLRSRLRELENPS